MMLPSDLLLSLKNPHVTNGRGSNDYGDIDTWDLAGQNVFFDALHIRASKDNFWSVSKDHKPDGVH